MNFPLSEEALRRADELSNHFLGSDIPHEVAGTVATQVSRMSLGSASNSERLSQATSASRIFKEILADMGCSLDDALTSVNSMASAYRNYKFTKEGVDIGYATSDAYMEILPTDNKYWFLILSEILETPRAKLRIRDVRMNDLCELVTTLGIVPNKLPIDALSIWALPILLDEENIKWGTEQAVLQKNEASDDGETSAFDTVKQSGASDVIIRNVNANFAWTVDALVRKFEQKKREIVSAQ